MSAIKATGMITHLAQDAGAHRTVVTLELYGEHGEALESLRGNPIDATFKAHRRQRSINANALCWELCSQIGKALSSPVPKEDVYRAAIRAVGEFSYLTVREDALEAFQEIWSAKGIGWFTELADESPMRNHVEVMAYHGSSTYDTKQMSTLIDYLIDEAQQMELPIAYDLREIERIKEAWARDRQV